MQYRLAAVVRRESLIAEGIVRKKSNGRGRGSPWLPSLLALCIGCGDDGGTEPQGDTVPPSEVADLRIAGATEDVVTLRWTSPGDDGHAGAATVYDLRRSDAPLTEATFVSATPLSPDLAPRFSGSTETFSVEGMPSGRWFFALKTGDEIPNWSPLSNSVAVTVGDSIAPSATTDLVASSLDQTTVELTWTAVGDDGDEGAALAYDVRRSFDPITDESWTAATPVGDAPTPSAAGTLESMRVTDLPPNVRLYFALRTKDNAGNESGLSNVASATTELDETPPGSVSDLALEDVTGRIAELSWTAPGDDDADGRATAYDVRYSTSPITPETFEQATSVPDLPAPSRPGERDSVSISGLDPITSYYVSLVTIDEAGNRSELSNVLSLETTSSWQLTFSPEGGSAHSPDWSPDGSTIAFQGIRDGSASIYMIPAEGGEVVRLTDAGGDPSWSPDGTRIAFTSGRAGGFSDIFVMDATPGAEAIQLTDHEDPAGSPDWSSDGEQISYHVPDFIQLYSPVTMYSVSPEGGVPRVLVSPGEDWGTFDGAWSPDGTRLVATCTRTYSWQLWIIPFDGGSWTQLTSTPFLAVNVDPCWSPDGTEIAYLSTMAGGREIYRLPAAGGTPMRLTFDDADDLHPAWSPDGTRIAFASNRTGTYEIWILLLE